MDAKTWTNVLAIMELLFSLPVANGQMERILPQLKLIKNNRRTYLWEDTLDQLLSINVDNDLIRSWNKAAPSKYLKLCLFRIYHTPLTSFCQHS